MGPAGATGPSNAYATYRALGDSRLPITLNTGGDFITVGQLDLPAGSYVVMANAMSVNTGTSTAIAYCLLLIGGQNAQALDTLAPGGAVGAGVTQALSVAETLSAPGQARLLCRNNGQSTLQIQTFNLNAIAVGALTFQNN